MPPSVKGLKAFFNKQPSVNKLKAPAMKVRGLSNAAESSLRQSLREGKMLTAHPMSMRPGGLPKPKPSPAKEALGKLHAEANKPMSRTERTAYARGDEVTKKLAELKNKPVGHAAFPSKAQSLKNEDKADRAKLEAKKAASTQKTSPKNLGAFFNQKPATTTKTYTTPGGRKTEYSTSAVSLRIPYGHPDHKYPTPIYNSKVHDKYAGKTRVHQVSDYEHSGDTEHEADMLEHAGATIVDTKDFGGGEYGGGRGEVHYSLPKGVTSRQLERVVDSQNMSSAHNYRDPKHAATAKQLDQEMRAHLKAGRGNEAMKVQQKLAAHHEEHNRYATPKPVEAPKPAPAKTAIEPKKVGALVKQHSAKVAEVKRIASIHKTPQFRDSSDFGGLASERGHGTYYIQQKGDKHELHYFDSMKAKTSVIASGDKKSLIQKAITHDAEKLDRKSGNPLGVGRNTESSAYPSKPAKFSSESAVQNALDKIGKNDTKELNAKLTAMTGQKHESRVTQHVSSNKPNVSDSDVLAKQNAELARLKEKQARHMAEGDRVLADMTKDEIEVLQSQIRDTKRMLAPRKKR